MAVKFIPVICPKCGADLSIEENRREAFCTYCGTKIIIQNDNEYVIRHIDEAKIKKEETTVRVKELELKAAESRSIQRRRSVSIVFGGLIMLLGIALCVIGVFNSKSNPDMFFLTGIGMLVIAAGILPMAMIYDQEQATVPAGMARVPSTIRNFESKDYSTVETMLVGAGFTNVTCLPLNDVVMGVFAKPGKVESITINGNEVRTGGDKFSKDASVIITYHSMRK